MFDKGVSMNRFLKLLVSLFVLSNFAMANVFNASLTPDIAVKKKSEKIEGVVIGLWTENPQTAFALGLVNGSTGTSQGFSLALIANYTEDYTGGHLALVNHAKGHFTGAQVGAGNYANKLTGLQFGLINYAKSIKNGVQIGLINIVPETKAWFSEFPNEVAPVFPFLNWRFE